MGRRKGAVLLAALALAGCLAGCRGGGWVFRGFHEDQDRALLERLAERYPEMDFQCSGQIEGSRHEMLAGDGTEFTAWTAPAGRGSFQVMEHYLEEWLADQGFYRDMEEKLTELGFDWEYESYNYYDRHFQPRFGPLDSPEQRRKAAEALVWAKERFDSLYRDFQEETGCESPMLYFHGSFTLEGEEHFFMFHLSMREDDIWGEGFAWDDYEAVLQKAAEQAGQEENIPNVE